MEAEIIECLERIANSLEGIHALLLHKEGYEFDVLEAQEFEDFISDELDA